MVGCANPTVDGDIVVALADRIELLVERRGARAVPARRRTSARTTARATRPVGFWVGTLALDERRAPGALYRLDGTGLTTILDGLTIANGIGWSPDGASDVLRRHADEAGRRLPLRR